MSLMAYISKMAWQILELEVPHPKEVYRVDLFISAMRVSSYRCMKTAFPSFSKLHICLSLTLLF